MQAQINQKIRKIRELRGYTQNYMACQLGISQRTYSKIEREDTKLDWATIRHIATILKLKPGELVSFDVHSIFTNPAHPEKSKQHQHGFSKELKEQYEARIAALTEQVAFLKEMLMDKHRLES